MSKTHIENIRDILAQNPHDSGALINYVGNEFVCHKTRSTIEETEVEGKIIQTSIDVASRSHFVGDGQICGVSLHCINDLMRLNVYDFAQGQYFGTNGLFRNLKEEGIQKCDLTSHPMMLDQALEGFAHHEFGLDLKTITRPDAKIIPMTQELRRLMAG